MLINEVQLENSTYSLSLLLFIEIYFYVYTYIKCYIRRYCLESPLHMAICHIVVRLNSSFMGYMGVWVTFARSRCIIKDATVAYIQCQYNSDNPNPDYLNSSIIRINLKKCDYILKCFERNYIKSKVTFEMFHKSKKH